MTPIPLCIGMADFRDPANKILQFASSRDDPDVIWQTAFTTDLDVAARKTVIASLRDLDRHDTGTGPRRKPAHRMRWVLCLPVDPDNSFLTWLADAAAPYNVAWEVWGEAILLAMLDRWLDIMQQFFFVLQPELGVNLRIDDLELLRCEVDPACQWHQPDAKVLHYSRTENVFSPDLVLDVVVRSVGSVDTMLAGLVARVRDYAHKFHGYPEEGLLLPSIEYHVSIGMGQPGDYELAFRKLLRVKAGELARFKVRLVDTGYAWNGVVGLILRYGKNGEFEFPWFRLYTWQPAPFHLSDRSPRRETASPAQMR